MVGDDDLGVQAPQDPRPVVVGEAASRDPGEEDVDAAGGNLIVDQVRAALVIERRSGDFDVQSVNGSGSVGRWAEVVEVIAGQRPVDGDLVAQQQL